MSTALINHDPSLSRLYAEGYQLEIREGHLIVHGVPYLDLTRKVSYGVLLAPLTIEAGKVGRPQNHVMHFAGSEPHDDRGNRLESMILGAQNPLRIGNVHARWQLSNKPKEGYSTYYDMVTTYVRNLSKYACVVEPDASWVADPTTFTRPTGHGVRSPFLYEDTASARAGTTELATKFKGQRVGIVGLGGSGSYVLDLIAKTPVSEIVLIDDDVFAQHNAFRAPGAPPREALLADTTKVEYLASVFGRMHAHITPHIEALTMETSHLLDGLDFVFVCVDSGKARAAIYPMLHDRRLAFVDVGMGLTLSEGGLGGTVRVTLSTPSWRGAEARVPRSDEKEDVYSSNIQIAELNAMGAQLGVMLWKRWCGFYHAHDDAHTLLFMANTFLLQREDRPETSDEVTSWA